ncbi:biotin--[acetyl-CoA-carboxylase] ligase [Anianabacter salinae]|uniref:biotin--[acetyl-CoA-carboxylase] ligase n=1 Tax=Anianabacter salinae TaxID=2851023 RepID=UPI00225E26AA|nr:biotin--[acetyl-CoA-carboxylase] ligase [Anianabacter salinae]MBV0911449.1 biotin--[acetyl-CoA-carboxylase] ligase [Anianabacter salinae]
MPRELLPWPGGVGRIILDEVDSTMAEAARRAPGLDGPTWIMARHQTAARGRQGKVWTHPAGNFAATLVMRPEGGPGRAALRSFMAANALFEALALKIDRTRLSLKWPNDVLLDNGKVAGILLESVGGGAGRVDWLSIGIGVNLCEIPDGLHDAAFPPVSLEGQGGEEADLDEFLSFLASHFATQERVLAELGFGAVRKAWLRQAARLGEVITARMGREEITGRFETVDEAGHLVLVTRDGERRIAAAEVFF